MNRTLHCTDFRLVYEENVTTAQNEHSWYSSKYGSNSLSIMWFSLCWTRHKWKPGVPLLTNECTSGHIYVMDQTHNVITIPGDARSQGISSRDRDLLVFGLGRIFRLERSALFMAEFRARLELGAINFHLKPCMFTWAKIGSPCEVTILALYSTVSSYHLTSTEFIITI